MRFVAFGESLSKVSVEALFARARESLHALGS